MDAAPPSPRPILDLIGAAGLQRALHAACELGVFDALASGPRTADQVAGALGTDPRATRILLAALVGPGLTAVRPDGRYVNSEAADLWLRRDRDPSLLDLVRFDAKSWDDWGRLADCVRTGRPARTPDMFQSDPQDTERFIGAMADLARVRGDAAVVARRLPFRPGMRVLDVGGGPASYAIGFCRAWEGMRATVFDLPATLRIARRHVDAAGMADRIDLVAGDFNRDPLPSGYDAVFLSNILHSEGEEACRRLLRSCFQALVPRGFVAVKEYVLDETRTMPARGAAFGLVMLLNTAAGDSWSRGQVGSWLADAGFERVEERPPEAPLVSSLLTAWRPAVSGP